MRVGTFCKGRAIVSTIYLPAANPLKAPTSLLKLKSAGAAFTLYIRGTHDSITRLAGRGIDNWLINKTNNNS